MAELTLTEAEKKSETYLEWSDEALGKAAKAVALILADRSGKDSLKVTGAAVFLIAEMLKANSVEMQIDLEGAHRGDDQIGNYKIVITRMDE